MRAWDILADAARVMNERGKQYDKPDGERSMAQVMRAFNAITGHSLTEQEGWLIMSLLKLVRQWQNPNTVHADSLLDNVAYAALLAESYMCSTETPSGTTQCDMGD